MRTAEEIEDRIRGLLVEELDRRVAIATKRLPHLCTHNHRHALDTRKTIEDVPNENYNRITREGRRGLPVLQSMGLCMLGAEDVENWFGTICEDPIDAQRCPVFHAKASKDDLWAEFSTQVRDDAWLQEHMPEVHVLHWVLNSVEPIVQVPWWKRLWFRLLRIRVTEPLPPFDPAKLLPPSTGGPGVG